jgi:hypothetical protein
VAKRVDQVGHLVDVGEGVHTRRSRKCRSDRDIAVSIASSLVRVLLRQRLTA